MFLCFSCGPAEHDLECTYPRDHRDKRQRSEQEPPIQTLPKTTTEEVSQDDRSLQQPHSRVDNRSRQQYATPAASENDATPLVATDEKSASEVMSTNSHSGSLEFYGSSSSVAFLRHVEALSHCSASGPVVRPSERPLTSLLHNPEFQPGQPQSVPTAQTSRPDPERFHFRVARHFLDAYFSNHLIQPFHEETDFLGRCEDLWFHGSGRQSSSFVALYYAVLSLGSLVMPTGTRAKSGADRFTWSRKLFNEAHAIVTRPGAVTDLETVQCFYTLSKICQHELNPHVAYLYSGQAARTALAIGLNRKPIGPDGGTLTAASQTWWAVYCLDIQTSFALGRPDSLGPDEYHTQSIPIASEGESLSGPHILQNFPCMIELARITRKVALDLYTQRWEIGEKLHRAKLLDAELEHWHEQLPPHLRSEYQIGFDESLKPRNAASFITKQLVVLKLRYLNLRMVIHAVFMTHEESTRSDGGTCLRSCQCQCMRAAEDTIDLMHQTFRHENFLQTWWYNATYALFAISILLAAIFHRLPRTQQGLEGHFLHIDRAIEVLQAMDDCVFVRKAIPMIKRTLARAKEVVQPATTTQQSSLAPPADLSSGLHFSTDSESQPYITNIEALSQPQAMAGSLGTTGGELDWFGAGPFGGSQQDLFWTEWAHELDTLGTQGLSFET